MTRRLLEGCCRSGRGSWRLRSGSGDAGLRRGRHFAKVSCWVGKGCEKRAYNPPSAKTIISALFCGFGRLSLRRTGMGRMMIARSVAMLIPAFVNPSLS